MLDEHPRAGDASQAAVEGVRWAAGVRLAAEVLALGAGVVLARAVTPAEFGRAVVATAILTVGLVLVTQLAGAPLVGLGSVSRRQLEAAAFLAVGGSVVTAAAAVGGALALAPWTGGDAAFLVEIGAIGILAAGVTSVPQALLQRSLRFRPLFIAEIAGVVVGAAVSVALALWVGLGAEALVLGVVAA